MAVTQPRCDPPDRKIYDDARRRGHTKKEAMRILKRHLSDVVYRRMIRDLKTYEPVVDDDVRRIACHRSFSVAGDHRPDRHTTRLPSSSPH